MAENGYTCTGTEIDYTPDCEHADKTCMSDCDMSDSLHVHLMSDVKHDNKCKYCHRAAELLKYCQDCNCYLCASCEPAHNGILTGHTLVDAAQAPKSLPTKLCPEHTDQLIDVYCADHDTVCCTKCRQTHHR